MDLEIVTSKCFVQKYTSYLYQKIYDSKNRLGKGVLEIVTSKCFVQKYTSYLYQKIYDSKNRLGKGVLEIVTSKCFVLYTMLPEDM
jgi:hypothetical protein